MAQIKKSTLFLSIAALTGLVAAVKFFMPAKSNQSEKSMTTEGEAPSSVPSKIVVAPMTGGMMKEAKAVATKANYKNPAGEDEVGFTLYIDSVGTIVDVKTDVLAIHDISKKRQVAFAEGLSAAVKGKKLSELTAIDKVGGSSLTTKVFNDALVQLKSQI